MTTVSFLMPIAEVPNSNARVHWSVTARKRALVRWAVAEIAQEVQSVATPAALTLTFTWPDKRRRDLDNFECKGAIDALVDSGVIPDDDGTLLVSVTRAVDPHGRTPRGTVSIAATLRHIPTESAQDSDTKGG